MQYDLNKKRGSNVAIDRELAGNIENPSFDVLTMLSINNSNVLTVITCWNTTMRVISTS